jgi:excisionase family DNA binding protein
MDNDTLTPAEVAKRLGVSAKTIIRYARSGLLKGEAERRGLLGKRRWRIERTSVEELVKRTEEHDNDSNA